jgi:hypothetical protein
VQFVISDNAEIGEGILHVSPSVPMIDMRSSMSNGVFSGMHHTVSSVAVAPPAKRYMVSIDIWISEAAHVRVWA